MQAQIPQWAYPFKPVAWARFVSCQPTSSGPPLEEVGRVPLWDSFTVRYDASRERPGESNLLIVRVLPEVEVIIKSDGLVDPDKLRNAIVRRVPPKKWPVRRWYLSHLVHVSPRAQLNKTEGVRMVRPCGSRVRVGKRHWRFLTFMPLFDLPVSVIPVRSPKWLRS
jgi:hypothetical protein